MLTETVCALSGLVVLTVGLVNALAVSLRLYPDRDTAALRQAAPNRLRTAQQGSLALLSVLDAAVKEPRHPPSGRRANLRARE